MERDSLSDSGWSSDEESEAISEAESEVEEQSKHEKDEEKEKEEGYERGELALNFGGNFEDGQIVAGEAWISEEDGDQIVSRLEGEQKGEKRKLEVDSTIEPPSKKVKLNPEAKPTVRRAKPFAFYTKEKEVPKGTKLLAVSRIVDHRWIGRGGERHLQLKLEWEAGGVSPEELWVYRHNTQGMEGLLQRYNHKCFQESKR